MNDRDNKYFIGGIFVFLLIIAGVIFVFYQKKAGQPKTFPQAIPTTKPIVPPTLTPERVEIIKKMETREISITGAGFEPASLKINVNDQVVWINKDSQNHKVTGEGWGNVIIAPGERYTKAFAKAGIFIYSCSLQPELKGEVIAE
jgi:plastocyanin